MTAVTKTLENGIKELVSSFDSMRNEGRDLFNLYWKGSVSSDISSLSGSDPVCKAAKLTKNEIINFVTMITELDDFWENASVAQSDYQVTMQSIVHGDAVLDTAISIDLEDMGARAVQFCRDMITQYNRSRMLDSIYVNSEISAAVSGLSDSTIVFGANMTKVDLTSAINMLRQFVKFVQNEAVTTGDYKSALGRWSRL